MPADYSSTAAALALSPSIPSPSDDLSSDTPSSTQPSPPWSRPRGTSSLRLARRYSVARTAPGPARNRYLPSFVADALAAAVAAATNALALFLRLPRLHQLAAGLALALALAASVLFLVYSHRILAWLVPLAQRWRDLPAGWLLVAAMVAATGFPPMFGYSTAVTVAGFVYGFPNAWPVVAAASTLGSTAAFVTSRSVCAGYVHALVGRDRRFVALGQVLRKEGLLVLTGVRLCPLPFSLSNGFLATVPSISPWSFMLATALASPKLLVHIFVASRLAQLAEDGDKMTAGDKAINYTSMLVGGLLGLGMGVFVYRRTMARAEELALEEGAVALPDGEGPEYADDGGDAAEMIDPDAAALRMDDDDISLWEADELEGPNGGYRDSEEGGAVGESNGHVNGTGPDAQNGKK